MIFRLVRELADDGFPVAAACRVLGVSRSGYYEWRDRPPSARTVADGALTCAIRTIWSSSRETYGVRRVRAELGMGLGAEVGMRRVGRLMRRAGIAGVRRRRRRGNKPAKAVWPDLVGRKSTATGPDMLWLTDITEHATSEGKVYCAVVLDAFSRRVVGWSIADHIKAELVVDALDMARWRRKPQGTVVHSDRGSHYVSWIFGHRHRQAGPLGPTGKIARALDNAMMESFFSSIQVELLDRRDWATRNELARAIFEWIEALHNPVRRHSAIGHHPPAARS